MNAAKGSFANTGSHLYVESVLNDAAIPLVGPGYQTEAFTAAISIPADAAIQNIDGYGAYITDPCDSRVSGEDRLGCNGTAFYSQSVATGDHAAVWGLNPVVKDNGTPNANLTGIEVDVGSDTTPYFVQGVVVEAGGKGVAPPGAVYFLAHSSGESFKPAYGYYVDRAATTSAGIVLDGKAFGEAVGSQDIRFIGYDSRGRRHVASIAADPEGTLTSQLDGGTGHTLSQVIAIGTAALGGAPVAPATCAVIATAAAKGVVSTDVISWSFAAPPGRGWPSLTIQQYPSTDAVNFAVCNPGASVVTPDAVTLNWRVVR